MSFAEIFEQKNSISHRSFSHEKGSGIFTGVCIEMESGATAFGWLDYVVWVLYMIFVAYFGLKASGKQQNARDYFLGGNGLPWWAVAIFGSSH